MFAFLAFARARVAVEVGSVARAVVVLGLLAFTLASRWVEVRCWSRANDRSRVARAFTSKVVEVGFITRAGLIGIADTLAKSAVEFGLLGWASRLRTFARAGGRIEYGFVGRAIARALAALTRTCAGIEVWSVGWARVTIRNALARALRLIEVRLARIFAVFLCLVALALTAGFIKEGLFWRVAFRLALAVTSLLVEVRLCAPTENSRRITNAVAAFTSVR